MSSKQTSQPTLTLYRGWKDDGVYVWSPFVTKVEARLRFAGLSYRTEAGSLSKAPKGKIPYIRISEDERSDATLLADSTIIIEHLVEEGALEDINAEFSAAERAHDLALRALLEDKLYFYQSYEKWHENYYTMRPHVLSSLPYPMQVIVGLLAHRKVMATLHGHGTSRFSGAEIGTFRENIWNNVNALLVESMGKPRKPPGSPFWVLGHADPSEADAVLFGFIVGALICTASPDSQRVVRGLPIVVDYARRIHDTYFPDYSPWD